MTSSMNAMKMSRKAPVSSTRPVVLTAKKPHAPSGSHRGSRVMLKFCQDGVASMPSNASVLSIRITKSTRSQPVGLGWSRPTPHGLTYTALMRRCPSRSASRAEAADDSEQHSEGLAVLEPLVAPEPDHAGEGHSGVSRRRDRHDPRPVWHSAGELEARKCEVGDDRRPYAYVGQLPDWA